MGRTIRVWTPERDSELKYLWREGWSKPVIARKFRVSRGAVEHAIKRLNLPRRPDYRRPKDSTTEEQWTRAMRGLRYDDPYPRIAA